MTIPERDPRRAVLRPPRYYAIDKGLSYPLRAAARALELPEGTLRRAILLEELAAQAVDDDRQYILEGSALQEFVRKRRPSELCLFPDGDSLIQDLVTVFAIPVGLAILLFLNWNPAASGPSAGSAGSAGKGRAEPTREIKTAPPAKDPDPVVPEPAEFWFPEYFNLPN